MDGKTRELFVSVLLFSLKDKAGTRTMTCKMVFKDPRDKDKNTDLYSRPKCTLIFIPLSIQES